MSTAPHVRSALPPGDLHPLRTFLEVARRGSFRAAADAVHLTPQAVSAHVRRLESELGVALLRRTTRRVSLTATGNEFADGATTILAEIDDLWQRTREAGHGSAGTVRLGLTYSAGNDFGPDLLDEASRCGLHVELHELATAALLDGLHEGQIDVGIALEPGTVDGVEGWPIATGTFAPVVVKTHPLAKRRVVGASDLQGLTLIVPQRSTTPGLHAVTMQVVDRCGLAHTAPSMTSYGIPKAVYEGTGFVFWPTVLPRRYLPDGLSVVRLREEGPPVAMWFLYRSDVRSPAARRLVEVARQRWPGRE